MDPHENSGTNFLFAKRGLNTDNTRMSAISVIIFLAVAVIVLAVVYLCLNARRRAPRVVALDLGGRLPAQRRRPCGRHGGTGGNCDDCEHKHEHGDREHCHRQ